MNTFRTALLGLALAALASGCASLRTPPPPPPTLITVSVRGCVRAPGSFSVADNVSLSEILNKAGCVEGSYLRGIKIMRREGDQRLYIGVAPVDPLRPERGQPLQLQDQDEILVPTRMLTPEFQNLPITVNKTFRTVTREKTDIQRVTTK